MFLFEEDRKEIKNILKHKYSCTDKSITAKYLLQYYWTALAKILPNWLAPNLITVFGLISMTLSCAFTLCNNFALNDKKFSNLHLINAVLLFVYSTFDALDGKQAVKTNNSTPLGQMFDHGVDSLVSTFTGITLASSLGLGFGMEMICLTCAIYIGFYLSTIHEKFTGTLSLGYINGPTEGVLLMVFLHLFSYFKSPEFFSFFLKNTFFKEINNFFLLISFVFLIYLINFFTDLFVNLGRKTFLILKNLFFILALCASLINLCMILQNNLCLKYLTVFSCMFIFSYMTIELIFSRIKNTEIPLPPFSYYFFILLSIYFKHLVAYNVLLILGCFLFSFSSFCLKVYSICYVVSEELKISVFKVKKKND